MKGRQKVRHLYERFLSLNRCLKIAFFFWPLTCPMSNIVEQVTSSFVRFKMAVNEFKASTEQEKFQP